MLRIRTFGYKSGISPLKSLDEAFGSLGHEVIEEGEPDLIYDGTGFFENSIECGKKHPNAIKIFNLLNADINNPNWGDGRNVREQLLQANIVTTVSYSTKRDIEARTGVTCEVIYFPMKKVDYKPTPKALEYLYVGRLFNKEKRFHLVLQTLQALKYPIEKLIVVGPENPGVGYHTGLISDADLSLIYNSSQYLFCPCIHEGSMSMLECVLADCFPLVCLDNHWVHEFGLEPFACEPQPDSFIAKIKDIENNTAKYVKIIDELKPKIIEKFDVVNVAKRIIDLYNKARTL